MAVAVAAGVVFKVTLRMGVSPLTLSQCLQLTGRHRSDPEEPQLPEVLFRQGQTMAQGPDVAHMDIFFGPDYVINLHFMNAFSRRVSTPDLEHVPHPLPCSPSSGPRPL